jgi:hypothetical protein
MFYSNIGIEFLLSDVKQSIPPFKILNFPAITEVKSAVVSDSGNYTCSPANTRPAHVLVFVNKGDNILQIEGRLQTNTSNYEHFSPDI